METKKKRLIAVAVIAGVGALTAFGLLAGKQIASAATESYSTIVENLAAKFNLDPAEVQQVFDDTEAQREEERLDKAVEDGTITEAQKTLILEKREELKTKTEEIDSQQLTAEERRTAMQDLMEATRTWAEENDIPMNLLHGGRGGPGGPGRGGPGMDGGMGPGDMGMGMGPGDMRMNQTEE